MGFAHISPIGQEQLRQLLELHPELGPLVGVAGKEGFLPELTAESRLATIAAMGFNMNLANMNLAPFLDVNSNPKNPVIGTRAFGGSPVLVCATGTAFIRGMQGEGVTSVAKHFPGRVEDPIRRTGPPAGSGASASSHHPR